MTTHGGVIDSGIAFEIVPNTRKVIVPQLYKTIGTVGEQNSEMVTFRCPKVVDGHEIGECSRKYVTWKNTQGDVGHNELQQLKTDDEYVYFTWKIDEGLTVDKGFVSFSVHFEDVDENGVVQYRFITTTCTECEILDAINGVLGKYKAMYVSGDTLVIKDYTPVEKNTLKLDSEGIVPVGTLEINKDGLYDVAQHAFANVEVSQPLEAPTITLNGNKLIATANGMSAEYPLQTPMITVKDGRIESTANGLNNTYDLEKPYMTVKNGEVISEANGLVSEPYGLDKPEFVEETVGGKNALKAIANGQISDVYELDTPTFELMEDGILKATANKNSSEYTLEAPTITVDASGVVKATANGAESTVNLSSTHDSDFVSENIMRGTRIFGLEGTGGNTFCTGTFRVVDVGDGAVNWFMAHYIKNVDQNDYEYHSEQMGQGETKPNRRILKNTLVVMQGMHYERKFRFNTLNSKNVELVCEAAKGQDLYIIRVLDDDFYIYID